ncbi:hypothetical protein ACPYO6_00460 [Georgenia sp. Z1344]|uniref:hypothetical protein n=1 Tax=Georgenia sp. Z1344 TaxID=3416706 RepID=UPI003CEF8C5C
MSTTTRTGALALGTAGLLAAAGCGAGAEEAVPATDADGLATQACALAIEASATPVDQWQGFIGDETQAEVLMVAGASGMLGATTQAPLPGYEDLLEDATSVHQGISRIDTEMMTEGLDGLVAACEERGLPDGEVDVAEESRVAYACALVTAVSDDGRSAEEWLTIGPDAPDEDAVVMAQVGGFSGVMGGMNGHMVPGHDELSRAAEGAVRGLMTIHTEELDESVDAGAAYCATL